MDDKPSSATNLPASTGEPTQPSPLPISPSGPPPTAQTPLPDWATVKPVESPWTLTTPPQPQPTAAVQDQPLSEAQQQATEPPPAAAPPPLVSPPPSSAGEPHASILGMMLKLLLGIIAVALVVFLGTKVFSFIRGKIAQPNKTVILTYWGLWEDKQILNSLISDFEREHPNIKVDYQKRDIKQYRETLKARVASGQGPDIFRFHNSWLPMFKDDLLPLPKAVLGETPQKDFYPVVEKDLKIAGAYFGIPLEIDTLLLFINTDLFKDADANYPKTWNDLKRVAPLLTVKDTNDKIKTAGVALGTYDNINHASDIISLMLVQNGVDIRNIAQAKENAQGALEFYTSFSRGKGQVWDDSLDPSVLMFAKGNLAMFFGFSWDVFTIKALNPNLNFEVVPAPQLSDDRTVTLASYWAEGVSKKSKNQKAAFEFLAYLTRKETVQKLYSQTAKTRLFGEPPSRVDLADSLKDNPYLSVVVNQAKDATSTFFASDTFDNGLNSELNKYLADAVRSMGGNTSTQTALEQLIKGVDSVFAKYGVR